MGTQPSPFMKEEHSTDGLQLKYSAPYTKRENE